MKLERPRKVQFREIGLSGVSQVSSGNEHTLFLKSDGSLHAVGRNHYGQLGDGTNTDRTTPIQILDSGVTQVAAGQA